MSKEVKKILMGISFVVIGLIIGVISFSLFLLFTQNKQELYVVLGVILWEVMIALFIISTFIIMDNFWKIRDYKKQALKEKGGDIWKY